MNTYTHFLWAVVLSRWILLSQKANPTETRNNEEGGQRCRAKLPRVPPFDLWGFLFGSVLPDLFLITTTVVCSIHDYSFAIDWNDLDDSDSSWDSNWTYQLFDHWYFENPWIEAGHNLFHSPVSLLILLSMVYGWHAFWQQKQRQRPRRRDSRSVLPDIDEESDFVENAAPSEAVPDNASGAPLELEQAAPATCCFCCAGSCSAASCRVCCRCWITNKFWFWALVSAMIHALCDIPVHHDDGPLIFWPVNRTYRYYSPVSYWDPNYYGTPVMIVEHVLDAIILVWLVILFCRIRRPWLWLKCLSQRSRSDGADHHVGITTSHSDEMEVMVLASTTTMNGYEDGGEKEV